MNRKLTIKAASIALLITSLFTTPNAFANYYAGVGVGVRPLLVEFDNFDVLGVKVNNLTEGVTKPAADFTLGYDHTFNNGFYLGAEAFYEYMDMSASVGTTVNFLGTTVNERVSAELDYNMGLGILLGYQTKNHDIFYTRIGAIYDELYYKAAQTVQGQVDDSTKGQHYAAAAQLGLGIIHQFNKHWSIRGEYTYTRYPNERIDIPVTVPLTGTSNVAFTPRVSINAATLSVLYRFA